MGENAKRGFRKYMNMGTFIFMVIVVYLSFCVFRYLGKEKLAVYEVSESNITESISGTGIVVREEALAKTGQEGYVNYYLKDGSNVKENGIVYIIDASGKLQAGLSELLKEKENVSSEEKNQIIEDLKSLGDSFSDDSFSEIYGAKNNINRDLMSYSDTIIAENKKQLKEKYGENCYVEVTSQTPGLVSFSSDGLEELKTDQIDQKDFDQRKKMRNLRSKEKLPADSPVYRIVTSQKWELVVSLNKDNYNRMKDLTDKGVENIQVTFHKDNFSTKVPFRCSKKKGEYYVILTFDNYVQRYLNQRYLSVELLLSQTKGLKIPSSSLVSKEIYKIPKEMLTKGSDSSTKNQVNVLTTNKKGQKVLHQQSVTIYRTEDNMVYISSDKLHNGDILSNLDKTERYKLEGTSQLQGVYIVNRGYAVFEPVVITERNEDYCIISVKEGSIELYDRVILNSDTIKENQVIY